MLPSAMRVIRPDRAALPRRPAVAWLSAAVLAGLLATAIGAAPRDPFPLDAAGCAWRPITHSAKAAARTKTRAVGNRIGES